MSVITRTFVVANYWECALWCLIATAFLGFWVFKRHIDLLIGGIAFGIFGLSDYIEAGTGAWWKPWWLLAIKAACILTFAILACRYWRRTRRSPAR